jgi:hypothetical protein
MEEQMFRLAAYLIVAGVTGLVAPAPAGAQQPVMGGTLFSTNSSAFSWTLLQAPSDLGFGISLRYSTGPGPGFIGFGGNYSNSVNGLHWCSDSACSPYSLGTPVFASVPSNTNLIVVSSTSAGPAQLLHTGMSEFKFLTQPDQPGSVVTVSPLAAVFYGSNNTASVGFASSAAGPFPQTFGSYPIQLSLTGVSRAVGQVPEPEMWILTLAGVLGAGLLRRRKRTPRS